MSENLRTNQAFGAGLVDSERPVPPGEPGLFDVRRFQLESAEQVVISTQNEQCSRIDIDVMNGTLHGFWTGTRGGNVLPDFQLSNGHRTYEFHPRPVTLTLYAGGGEQLRVSVLLTNPIEAKRTCGCGGKG